GAYRDPAPALRSGAVNHATRFGASYDRAGPRRRPQGQGALLGHIPWERKDPHHETARAVAVRQVIVSRGPYGRDPDGPALVVGGHALDDRAGLRVPKQAPIMPAHGDHAAALGERARKREPGTARACCLRARGLLVCGFLEPPPHFFSPPSTAFLMVAQPRDLLGRRRRHDNRRRLVDVAVDVDV